MKDQIIRKIFNGFIYIHILHHGCDKPFYGTWMMEELKEHGYHMSPGSLYPMLKTMVEEGLLEKEDRNVNGKIRKYYVTTSQGKEVLKELRHNIKELFHEVV